MRLRRLELALVASLALVLSATHPGSAQTVRSVAGVVESTHGGLESQDGSLQVAAAHHPSVVVPDDYTDVAAAVASLTDGGTVYVRARDECYSVATMIHLDRSRLSLIGEEGACLRLADHVNLPVILIGSSSRTVPPEERISDVAVRGFRVDGNRLNQDQEGAAGLPNVQNNAIGVRGAERVLLDRLILTGARSGGLVISQQASEVFVSGVTLSDNHFDGLAIDGASEVLVDRFVAEDNLMSGLSVDTGSSRVQVRGGLVQRNGHNGLFIRFTRESSFTDLTLVDNCRFGVFASYDDQVPDSGLVEVTFSGLRIFRNDFAGFFLGSDESNGSADNFLTHSQIGGNAGSGAGDELGGVDGNAAITLQGNAVVPFRTDGPTNRSCPP